jgi:hypothetical protein
MAIIQSYNLTNTQRDVFEQFEDLRVKVPNMLNLLRLGARPLHTKHEWAERSLSETTTTVDTAPSPATSGTSITLDATAGIEQYDLLTFTSSDGEERSEVVQVTVITSAPEYTITRSYGSSTASSIAVGDIVRVVKPQKGGKIVSDYSLVSGTAPSLGYNYTQIIDRTVRLSRTAQAIRTYGNVNGMMAEQMDDQIAQQSLSMVWEMNNVLLNGFRVEPANATTAKGAAGGFKQFLASGVATAAGGAAISVELINDTMQSLYENGALMGEQIVALCNPVQARKVSQLNNSGTNPVVMLNQTGTAAGQAAVTSVLGDLPGVVTQIRVDSTIPTDVIYLINPALCEVNYLEPYTIVNATASGDDAETRILKAEYTFTIKNGKTGHGKITGLEI